MLARLRQILLNPTEEDMNNIAIILIGLGLILLGFHVLIQDQS